MSFHIVCDSCTDLTEEDFQPLSEEESRTGLQALKERIARETGAVI